MEDAHARGWQREVERHQATADRIESLLTELGESLDGDSGDEPNWQVCR